MAEVGPGPRRLRTFQVPVKFQDNYNAGGSNGEDSVKWSQSMGQVQLIHRLEGILEDRREWTNEDVKVEMSAKSMKVLLNGEVFKPLSADFQQLVWRFKSWWAVEDGTLIINLYKREFASWRHAFHRDTGATGMFRRNPFPWTQNMQKHAGAPNLKWMDPDYSKDAPKEEEMEEVLGGRPETLPGELRPDGTVQEAAPGGVFALPHDGIVCTPNDLCLGITAQQDDYCVTIEVHFERDRYERLRHRYPLEALLAADIFPNSVCVFFQGDRNNPILFGELSGQVAPESSTWRIGSSDPMRRRQVAGDRYSPCVSIRLLKAGGDWSQVFKETWQHKLMVKELGPFGPEHFEGLDGGKTYLRAGFNLDEPDFWANVDNYAFSTMKQSGYTSAPKKLAA